ncbi:helix-turn-helix transcriptional regulator, partial [Amnimonas aquatica]
VERPLPTYDRQLVRLLEDQCRQLLAQRQPAGVAGQVRQCLLGPLGLLATLEDVAGALLVSPRSLRRKLEAEGASFRGIVEEAREQLALQLLEMTDMKLDELSLHLGYADTASFTRAFRRWQGISPGQHRTRARAPQDSHA